MEAEYSHPDSEFDALEALVSHVVGAFGWREVGRTDDGMTVTLFNGRDWIDFSLTPDETRDAYSEQSYGVWRPREFNAND